MGGKKTIEKRQVANTADVVLREGEGRTAYVPETDREAVGDASPCGDVSGSTDTKALVLLSAYKGKFTQWLPEGSLPVGMTVGVVERSRLTTNTGQPGLHLFDQSPEGQDLLADFISEYVAQHFFRSATAVWGPEFWAPPDFAKDEGTFNAEGKYRNPANAQAGGTTLLMRDASGRDPHTIYEVMLWFGGVPPNADYPELVWKLILDAWYETTIVY